VQLNAGESKQVRITIPQLYLSIYDEQQPGWKLVPGSYSFMVGGSSADLPLVQQVDLSGSGATSSGQ
jgi:beta-glucosidase